MELQELVESITALEGELKRLKEIIDLKTSPRKEPVETIVKAREKGELPRES